MSSFPTQLSWTPSPRRGRCPANPRPVVFLQEDSRWCSWPGRTVACTAPWRGCTSTTCRTSTSTRGRSPSWWEVTSQSSTHRSIPWQTTSSLSLCAINVLHAGEDICIYIFLKLFFIPVFKNTKYTYLGLGFVQMTIIRLLGWRFKTNRKHKSHNHIKCYPHFFVVIYCYYLL